MEEVSNANLHRLINSLAAKVDSTAIIVRSDRPAQKVNLNNEVGRFDLSVRVGGADIVRRNVQRLRGGLVFKAHRLLYHSNLGLRVIKKKRILFAPRGSCISSALPT